MLPSRDPPQNKRPTQTESEELEKKYSKQMDMEKKIWGSNTYNRQNRLQNKSHKKKQRRTQHNLGE